MENLSLIIIIIYFPYQDVSEVSFFTVSLQLSSNSGISNNAWGQQGYNGDRKETFLKKREMCLGEGKLKETKLTTSVKGEQLTDKKFVSLHV